MTDETNIAEWKTNLQDAATWLREEYNQHMEIYEQYRSIRLTNGSAAMYVDIACARDKFVISGERYGETFTKQCDIDKESLLDTLSRTF